MEPVVYRPQPIAPTAAQPGPGVLPAAPMTVAYIPGPDGRMVATYVPLHALSTHQQTATAAPVTDIPPAQPIRGMVSPLMVNVLLSSGSFALVSLGVHWLLADLVQLMRLALVLAAIVCGAPVAWRLLQLLLALTGHGKPAAAAPQTTINAKRVKIGKIVNKGGAR